MPHQTPGNRLQLETGTMHKFLQGAMDSVSFNCTFETYLINFLTCLYMTLTCLAQPCEKVDLKVTNHMKFLSEHSFAGRDIAAM
jgi:hypothetical protein